MEKALESLIAATESQIHRIKHKTETKPSKRPRIEPRIPTGCLQLHLFPAGYQIMVAESKQSSSLIPYSNRDILENVEQGRIPEALSDWLDLDKVSFQSGSVDMAIVERNETGSVLSMRVIPLAHGSTHLESSQILSETRQIYRWSARDRLALDACLALSTNEPLCLDPSPMVHLVNNFTQSKIRTAPTKRKTNHDRMACSPSQTQSSFNDDHPILYQPSSNSTLTAPVRVPIMNRSRSRETEREVRLESTLGSARQISIIKLTAADDGGFLGAVSTCRYFPSSEAPAHRTEQTFHAESPREAELYLQQYVSLFSNNSTHDSTITVFRDGSVVQQSERSDAFPTPFFPELAQNMVDPPLVGNPAISLDEPFEPSEPFSSDPFHLT